MEKWNAANRFRPTQHQSETSGIRANIDVSKMPLAESLAVAWRAGWTGQHINTIPNLHATSRKASAVEFSRHAVYVENFLKRLSSLDYNGFPVIHDVGFVASPGEKVYSKSCDVWLNESRAVRSSRSFSRDRTLNGSWSESSSHQEMTHIAIGDLYVTNQRVLFISSQTNRSIPIKNILSFDSNWSFSHGLISMSSSTRQRAMQFEGGDAFCATAAFWFVKDFQFRELLRGARSNYQVVKNILINTATANAKKEFDEVRDRQAESNAMAGIESGCGCLLIVCLVIGTIVVAAATGILGAVTQYLGRCFN